MTAQPASGKQPRFPQLSLDQLDDKQKPLGEQVMKAVSYTHLTLPTIYSV